MPRVCMFCFSPACSNSATDVVFLIDGSKSVRPENFELVKKWINQIIDKLDVSESKAHVGLVQYSSTVKPVRVSFFFFYIRVSIFTSTLIIILILLHRRSFPWAATTTRRTSKKL